ncbi:MAG TPA: glycoside hydrolase family 43 protein [Acidimicrobiia bacterium]|nr:glycoside hydrolase family 43 protein [Acidimicrobiia bacterium]
MRILFGFLAAAVGLSAVAPVTPVAAQSGAAATLAYDGDFPDPFVMVDGGRYYAYSTQIRKSGRWTNVPVMSSTDLDSWSSIRDALPRLPGWARSGNTWAPAVIERSGRYLLYYTTTERASRRQCISVATATKPAGPFRDSSTEPLVCQRSQGGSIDPYAFADPGGGFYLLWKSDDNAVRKPTALWSRELASDGLGWASGSETVRLLGERPSRWHFPIEGPAIVRTNDRYFLFYGGGRWNSVRSGIGYATCESPLGPCTDETPRRAWLETGATAADGPHGPTVFTDLNGALRFGFSGWIDATGYPEGARAFWTGRLGFNDEHPAL